ncbi:MAG TPA: apolipoprotein N-acyltransferase [Gallionella sp.]|nr:apolipoprotein N-acyltransferase [Gallionella sp.]
MGLFNKNHGLALLAGAMCVFGFSPFGIFVIPVLALAALFSLWLRADSARTAAWLGLSFGLGLFSAGIGWIYIAMYEYGDMPLLLALLATLLFAAFWALLPALAGFVQARFTGATWLRIMLVMPAVWALLEWFRGLLVTGFPWLTLGYAHSDSPLAGYAPLLGVYGVSFAAAVSAGSLLLFWRSRWSKQGKLALLLLLSVWGLGALLRTVVWTQPFGEPFSVVLVQGNIPQNLKFNEDALVGTLETYRRLVEQNSARLTVLPETALPLHRHEVPQGLIEKLRGHVRQNGGDVLIGAFERNNGSYYNSVFSLGVADEQHYRKQHLVPFGEFIPLRPLFGWLINSVLDIPMGDLARGDAIQAPLAVAGQQVAVNICYEDVFGEEIIRALPQATLLVNVTNDAWYGNSPVAAQHNQIAQLRAQETGRMMLRATNTGVTSIIGANGKVLQQLPQHEEGVLLGMAQGFQGITPYVRWGNAAILLLLVALLAYAWARRNSSFLPPSAPSPAGGRGLG